MMSFDWRHNTYFLTALTFGALASLRLSNNSVFFFNVAQPSQKMCVAHFAFSVVDVFDESCLSL